MEKNKTYRRNIFHQSIDVSKIRVFSLTARAFYVLYVLFILISTSDSITAEELIWPIDSPKSITSSFGEPRPGRFHYGVDFRSGGIIGKKVYALGDGYISRIRTSPFGYGKVLYLTMDNGKIAVYAHLSGFLPEIEERLFATRIQKKSFDVELWPNQNEYRVSKGQIIAYSGDTGDGGPHLHLEIRDRNNQPLNPLEHGLKVRDSIPPEISAVVLMPLDNSSTVDGFPVAQWYDPASIMTEPPVLSGNIGVAVSVWDRANNSRNHLGIYTLSLAVDSLTVFSKNYTRIPYNFNGFGGLDYLQGRQNGRNGYLSALFRRQGNKVDFYEGDGVLSADSANFITPHSVTISANDYEKNTTQCSFRVLYCERPVITQCGYNGNGDMRITGEYPSGLLDRAELWRCVKDGEWIREHAYPLGESQCDIDIRDGIHSENASTYKAVLVAEDSTRSRQCVFRIEKPDNADAVQTELSIRPQLLHDRILVRITASAPLSSLPLIQIEINGVLEETLISAIPENDSTWVASIPLPSSMHTVIRIKTSAYDRFLNRVWDMSPLEFTRIGSDSTAAVYSPDSLFTMTILPGSLYRPAPVLVDTVKVRPDNKLKAVTQGYRINWGDSPLKKASPIRLSLKSEPPEGSALFVSGNGNGWKFFSKERDGKAFVGNFGGSGLFAVLTDRHVPYIKPLTPKPGGTIQSRRPLLKAFIEDKGAGIEGSDSISMTIDTIPIYGEYDFQAHTVSYKLFNNLNSGKHIATVSVTDRVGNEKTRSWSFTVR